MIDNETGQVKFKSTRKITSRRSIFATDFIIDEVTGEVSLIKHLNQDRFDHCTCKSRTRKWNKTGNKSRVKGGNSSHTRYCTKSQRKIEIDRISLNIEE